MKPKKLLICLALIAFSFVKCRMGDSEKKSAVLKDTLMVFLSLIHI